MAVDLIFSISQELCNREVFLIVEVREKGRSRILYLPTLKEFGKVDPELSTVLIEERCLESGMFPNSHQTVTLACNKIKIRATRSLEVLQKLIISKRLFWKGDSLFFNPLSKTKLFLEAENREEEGSISISGFIELDRKKDRPFWRSSKF